MQRRIQRRQVDGVLLLDKPAGMTSNTALQRCRRMLNAAKAGHTGTLDPMATGLLPLTFGEATKFSQMLLDADKTYEATLVFGVETDTGDADGKSIAVAEGVVEGDSLGRVLTGFVGEIEQIPPMYSALKRDGKPLYEYARAGIEVERTPRRVRIHSLELLQFGGATCVIRVACSKGTYIRTLAMDIGAALGCGAHLSALRRTRIGPFRIGQAVSMTDLDAASLDERDAMLAPVDALVRHLPQFALDAEQTRAILYGQSLKNVSGSAGLVRLYGDTRFLGLGEFRPDGELSPKRLVASAACS
ncbi:tRNA pseudouridine(55) synthase TruB [Rhodocyclaceae bacterium SMB388]